MQEQGKKKYFGLWPSERGGYTGTIEIDGKEYWANLYDADITKYKQNPPRFNLSLKEKQQKSNVQPVNSVSMVDDILF